MHHENKPINHGRRALIFLMSLVLMVSMVGCLSGIARKKTIRVTPPNLNKEFFRGPRNAEITLIEYSDFECGFCRRHHPVVARLLSAFPKRLNVVYRHFPLKSHPNAMPAAMAAECAGSLGGAKAFWKFSDLLFSEGPAIGNHAGYAKLLGLNASAFQACVGESLFEKKIREDIRTGLQAGLTGTPYNVIFNNRTGGIRVITGAYPFEHLKGKIQELLAGKK